MIVRIWTLYLFAIHAQQQQQHSDSTVKLPARQDISTLKEWYDDYSLHDPYNQFAGYGLHSLVKEQFGEQDDSCFETQDILNKCCIFEPTHKDCWDVLGRYSFPRCCADMLTVEPGQCLYASFQGNLLAGEQLENIMNSIVGHAVGSYFPGLHKTIDAMLSDPRDYTFNKFSCPLGWSYLALFRARDNFGKFQHNFVDVSPLAGALRDLTAFYTLFTVRRAFMLEDRVHQARPTARPFDPILADLEKEIRTAIFGLQARSFLNMTGILPQMYCECHFGYDIAVSVRILAMQLVESLRAENGFAKPDGPTAEHVASQFCHHVTHETNPLQWFVEATIVTRCMPLEAHTHALCLARSLLFERDSEHGVQRALNLATMMALGALLSADCEEAFDWPLTTQDMLSWYSTVDQALSIPQEAQWDAAMYPLNEVFGEYKYPQTKSTKPLAHPLPDIPRSPPFENLTLNYEFRSPEDDDNAKNPYHFLNVRNNDFCGNVYENACFDKGRLVASKKDLQFFTWPGIEPVQHFARYCLQTHHEYFPAVPIENIVGGRENLHFRNGIAILLGNNINMMINLYHAVSVLLLALDQVLKVAGSLGLNNNWRDYVQIVLFPMKFRGGTGDLSSNQTFWHDSSLLELHTPGLQESYENNHVKEWFGILSSHKPIYLKDLPKGDCWSRILIGTPQGELGPVPWRLRPASHASLVWANAITPPERVNRNLYVRLIQRSPEHNRIIVNPHQVINALKYSLPLPLAARVRKEGIVEEWASLPLAEQLLRAASTGVLIGAHGATLMHSAWVPEGALVIELMPAIPHYIHPLCQGLNSREVFFGYAAAVAGAWYVCIPQKIVVDRIGDIIWRETPTMRVHPPRLANIVRKLGPRIARGARDKIPRERISLVHGFEQYLED